MNLIPLKLLGVDWGLPSPNDAFAIITSGQLRCHSCGELITPRGGDGPGTSNCGLCVYAFVDRPPTNIVCPECRGLLEPESQAT